jgi:hypothetical protein
MRESGAGPNSHEGGTPSHFLAGVILITDIGERQNVGGVCQLKVAKLTALWQWHVEGGGGEI